MLVIQNFFEVKPCRLFIAAISMVSFLCTNIAFGETCEGDKIIISDAAALPSAHTSAMSGDAHTQAILGVMYLRGEGGGEKDTAKGLLWLEKTAVGGDSEGQYLLGEVYAINGKSEADFHKAADLFQKSADQGCLPALFYLGALNLKGKGVPKNTEYGLRLITKAAEAGMPMAQILLSSMLITGDGISKDAKSGFDWMKRAADADDSVAEIGLANLYVEGVGTLPNPEKARTLLEKVYAKKDKQAPTAAFVLGWMYMDGKRVPVDVVKAFSWMIIAAKSNVSDSLQRLKTLTELLPKQKLSVACSVYLDPLFASNGAKEFMHVIEGETVAILTKEINLAEVYFPDRRLLGFVPRQCLQ